MEDLAQKPGDLFKITIENLGEPILLVDANHHILFANKTARKIFGRDPAAEHLSCHQVIHQLDRPCHLEYPGYPCPLREVISAKAPKRIEHYHHGAPGSKTCMEHAAWPILDEMGNVSKMVLLCHDITEEKLDQEMRNRLILDLQEALVKTRRINGQLSICRSCKKVCDQGVWRDIETFIAGYINVEITNSLCLECEKKVYTQTDDKSKKCPC